MAGLHSPVVTPGVLNDLPLRSLQRDEERTLAEWTTTFQLLVVAIDPYTAESAAILPTAARVLRHYNESNSRNAFVITCDADGARQFLGPLVDEFMVFLDPDGAALKSLGLTTIPAIAHIDQTPSVVRAADGWDPAGWRSVVGGLSQVLSWSVPLVPTPEDPRAFAGTTLT
jgi:hypothetical protein